MFRVTPANPAQKRTLRPVYATHQATAWAGFLDPNWARTSDIVPGTVMARKEGEVFTVFTGAAGQKPFGLSALFVAPSLSIDEVIGTGSNNFTVWVGGEQAVFEILTHENAVAELVDVISTDKILVRLNRFDLASSVGLAGGS
jgi:hypothetical protein